LYTLIVLLIENKKTIKVLNKGNFENKQLVRNRKTENMKARFNLKTVALVIAVIFTVGTANATEKLTKASSRENIVETSLQLENWMTDDNIWNKSSAFNYSEVADSKLEIENWMTNSDVWSTSEKFVYNEISDASLEMENWMTDVFAWNVKVPSHFENENETELQLENWMVNENVWNR